MASAEDFRDSFLTSFLVGYDWERCAHFAELAVRRDGAPDRKFRVDGLSGWAAFEDFGSQHISHCTLLQDQHEVYLCLDPHVEGSRSEKDNYWFVGTAVAEFPN